MMRGTRAHLEHLRARGRDTVSIDTYADAIRIADELRSALEWYAERRNYRPAGGESEYDAVSARDSYDGDGPGARARSALGATPPIPYDLRARTIADQATALLQDHDRRQHGGERCHDEPINFLAFLAHAFGIHAGDGPAPEDAVRAFVARVRDYGAVHEELHV